MRYFKSKEYNWTGLSQQPSLLAKAKRSVLQFTPYSFDDFQWGVFSSPLRFMQVHSAAQRGVALKHSRALCSMGQRGRARRGACIVPWLVADLHLLAT